MFSLGNLRRLVGEMKCEPPTVGRKSILGVGTRLTKIWKVEKHDSCRRIVNNMLLGVQGTLRIRGRQVRKGGLKETVES